MGKGPTKPATPEHQQMDRSNDPVETAAMDAAAPAMAMESRRQRLAGSAVGVGSVGFDEAGAYDVGSGREAEAVLATGPAPAVDSWDMGESAEVQRVRAGGLAPGEADRPVGEGV